MKIAFILITLTCLSFTAMSQSDSVAIARIKGETHKAMLKKDGTLSILNHKGKVIFFLKNKNLYDEDFWRLKFEDFNGDGYKDLIIGYRSNVPDICDLILFDNHRMKFVQIKDFPNYPAAIRLKGTNLFYSYHRSGCADENWDSDLFKIQNFKIVKLGNISGQACVDPPDKPGIYISKFAGKRQVPVKKFPLTEIDNFKDSKWGFIDWYWKHNFPKFTALN